MAPVTSASLRERIVAEKARESSGLGTSENAGEGGLLPTISQAMPGAPAALASCTWTKADDAASPASPASPPLPSARRLARPRKKPPQRGRLGVDIFALWEKAGRINTPVSTWRAGRDVERHAERGGGFMEGSTMRSAIVGPARLPDSPRPDSAEPTAFEGHWVSRQDGEQRGRIAGNWLIWADDGSRTRLQVIKSNSRKGSGDVITMNLDGEIHTGVLSEDGHILRWGDGDRWLRIDESYEEMQSYCADSQRDSQDILMQGWSVSDRCVFARQLQSISRPGTGSTAPSTPKSKGGKLLHLSKETKERTASPQPRGRTKSPQILRPATAR